MNGHKKVEELTATLKKHKGERHAVILQDFPDPDAISCGLAYRMLVKRFDIEADLLFTGRISHQENIAMVHLLSIEMIRCKDGKLPKKTYHGCVFVDNQGTTSKLTTQCEKANLPVVAVIDHHADQERLKPEFMDLRPAGACASLFVHYFSDGIATLKTSDIEHRRLATALMHGLVSETASMIRAEQIDFTAAAMLQPFYDAETLVEILHQQRSHKVMEIIQISLANRVERDGFCLAGVSFIRQEERDAIPQAADFLITEENIHTAIVYGVVTKHNGEESVHGSLRTTKHTLIPDTFLKEALGRSENGDYYGGGKNSAGGFEIPLGFLSGQDDKALTNIKWQVFDAKIRKKIFSKIGIEEY